MADDRAHDVYPNAPFALIVLAVEFPLAPLPEATLASLREELRTSFPLVQQEQHQRVVMQAGLGIQQEIRDVPRFTTRDRTMAVAVTPDSVVIETTRYLGFEWYLDVVREPIATVAEVLQPDAILAIGHRYIDEVRVPAPDGTIDWARWLDPALLAAAHLPTDAALPEPHGWQAMINYQTAADSTLTLRYGPAAGAAVPAEGATRRKRPPLTGPFFLLDWDSRWQPSVAPEFTADEVLARCADLYAPVRKIFHHISTDELRGVFAEPPEAGERP